jgi:uncharacterized RDD family membrane protein YckC
MAAEYKIIGGDGHEYGPATLEELRQWCEDGRVAPATLVWRADEARWLPADSRDELKWDLPKPVIAPPVLTAETPRPGAPRRAGFWIRFLAYLFDWLIVLCLISFVTLPWAEGRLELQKAVEIEMKAEKPDPKVLGRALLTLGAVDIPVAFAYFILFNALRGATPGKRMLGLRIVRLDGSPIGFGQAIGRQFADWLSKATLGFGYLLIGLTPERRALHDLLARTQVIYQR